MWATIAGAAACVFTGPREEGGCALAEAMLAGAPVVVLAHGGARLLAESNTDAARVALVEPGWTSDTARRLGAAMTSFALAPTLATGATWIRRPRSARCVRPSSRPSLAGAGTGEQRDWRQALDDF
jgi:glycosyltransferase involved in cell wall biosynthesis